MPGDHGEGRWLGLATHGSGPDSTSRAQGCSHCLSQPCSPDQALLKFNARNINKCADLELSAACPPSLALLPRMHLPHSLVSLPVQNCLVSLSSPAPPNLKGFASQPPDSLSAVSTLFWARGPLLPSGACLAHGGPLLPTGGLSCPRGASLRASLLPTVASNWVCGWIFFPSSPLELCCGACFSRKASSPSLLQGSRDLLGPPCPP